MVGFENLMTISSNSLQDHNFLNEKVFSMIKLSE